MSDIFVAVIGKSKPVDRSFRRDVCENNGIQIMAHQMLEICEASTGKLIEQIQPGYIVWAVKPNCQIVPERDQCQPMLHLAMFYVLEIVSGSEAAEALVLPVKKVSQVINWTSEQISLDLHGTDLVIGDQPFYIYTSAIVGSAPAVFGAREPGRPRLHACLVGANTRMRFSGRKAQISDLRTLDEEACKSLLACAKDAQCFLNKSYLAPSNSGWLATFYGPGAFKGKK